VSEPGVSEPSVSEPHRIYLRSHIGWSFERTEERIIARRTFRRSEGLAAAKSVELVIESAHMPVSVRLNQKILSDSRQTSPWHWPIADSLALSNTIELEWETHELTTHPPSFEVRLEICES
jgi:hypothetical protein